MGYIAEGLKIEKKYESLAVGLLAFVWAAITLNPFGVLPVGVLGFFTPTILMVVQWVLLVLGLDVTLHSALK